MPLYDFECKKCKNIFESFLKLENYKDKVPCPKCKGNTEKVITVRQKEPTFTDKLYPYFDKALNKVFHSPSERKSYLKEKDLVEVPSKDGMTRQQEREMYSWRLGKFDPRQMRHEGR